MVYILSLLWFIRTTKIILFYFYLWQLKEYHLGRFLDHFRTYKGRNLVFNRITLIKAAVLIFLSILLLTSGYSAREFFLLVILGIVSVLYVAELLFVFKNIFLKELKIPVLTKKTVILIPSAIMAEILILSVLLMGQRDISSFVFWLLLIDILMPLVVSGIVLFFQLPTIILRAHFILAKAKKKRVGHKNLIAIGITGSYGKTSTKEFLAAILSQKYNVLKTKEHQNSEAGISQCILKELEDKHQVFVAEMGAYGPGGIGLLADIVKPKIGVLTGINEQHLALFGSQDNIIYTKYELIKNLPKDGLAVFNGDNSYCLELYNKTKIPKKIYRTRKSFLGADLEADIWAEDIKVAKEYVSFKAKSKKGEEADFIVNVLGIQNIPNILASIVVAQELGMDLAEISKAAEKIGQEQGPMKIIKAKNDPYVIDSSYSANPQGVIADLNYLKIWPSKKAVIMPCLIELGKMSKKAHQKIGRKIAEVCDLAIITTKERFKEIKEGALAFGMKEENIVFIEKPDEIIERITVFSSPGDVVLLEGRAPEKVIKFLTR